MDHVNGDGDVVLPDEVDEVTPQKKRRLVPPLEPEGEALLKSALARDKLLKPAVKIYTVATEPNYSMPWQMKKQKRSTSSGLVIHGRRILTNAHAIANQTSVLVRKHGNAKKFLAKVIEVGHECDLALLSVEESTFWEDLEPVDFGDTPHLQEAVTVVGYPTGGDNISVTTGVVSRVDITTYAHSGCKLLAIQIDAAINSGNSGGPAFRENKLVGIAFETLVDAENIGYIIPTPIIRHFLEDVEQHLKYTGFCDLGVSCQSMESNHLRSFMKMSPEQTGILVNRTEPLSAAAKFLNRFDVILASDGTPIADDGSILFRNEGERISFRYLYINKFPQDKCLLTILRNGEVMDVELSLGVPTYLVPIHQYDKIPSYFTFAGLLFVNLTRAYLRHQWGKHWDTKAPIKLCDKTMNEMKEFPEQEVVILSQVLAAEVNIGYQNMSNIQVFAVNDVKVKNLKHLCDLVESSQERHIKFDFEFQRTIILELEAAKASTADILRQHGIPSAKSADLH